MIRVVGLFLLALVFSGCSTPESRIRKNPVEFAALTPEQQELVREGNIALGLPAAGVRLALGGPKRVFTRYSDQGETHVWSYGRTDQSRSTNWVTVTARDGSRHLVDVDEYSYREVETLRIEFRDGVVAAVEKLNP